jgi:hypothetical protein
MATPIQILSSHSIVSADVRTALKTLTLPVVSTNIGKLLFIKDTFGNSANCNINLSTIGLDRFERSINSNLRLSTNFGCWTLTNTGTSNWIFLNSYTNSIPKYPLASSFLYSPAANQSLTFWFDAADATTLTLVAGTPTKVSAWRSKIGGLTVTQTTAGFRPTYTTNVQNGLPVLQFSQAGRTFLTACNVPIIGTNSLTIIGAFQYTSTDEGYVFSLNAFGTTSNGQIIYGRNASQNATAALYITSSTESITATGNPGGNAWQIMSFVCNREQRRSTLFMNSSNLSNITIGYDTTNILGSNTYRMNISIGVANSNDGVTPAFISGSYNSYFTGNMGEILVFNTALSDTDRFKAESYLATKWGSTGSISATNPYKNTPPTFAN